MKRGNLDTETRTQGERRVTIEAEIRINAAGHQQRPRRWERSEALGNSCKVTELRAVPLGVHLAPDPKASARQSAGRSRGLGLCWVGVGFLGCCIKAPQRVGVGAANNRAIFSHSLETRRPESRCQRGWCLLEDSPSQASLPASGGADTPWASSA